MFYRIFSDISVIILHKMDFKSNATSQIIWKNMESDSIKRQLWFNETIKNNHINLRCSLLFF
jgi:hypothetical protein